MVEVTEKRTDALDYEAVLEDFMRVYAKDVALPEMVERLCAYVAWVRQGLCFIRNQSSEIVPLVHNRIQHVQIGAAMFQAARGMPVRLLILKARKGGSSTLWQTIMVFFGSHYPNQIGLMLAHVPDSTREIFLIAKLASKHYPAYAEPLDLSIRWPQSTGSRYYCHTAGGANVGAGGTPSMLHLSEVALYERNKIETLTSSLKSVPYELTTIVILESTARGREEFFSLFDDARNDADHPFTSIFVPWFLDERLTLAPPDRMVYDDDERMQISLARREYGIELSNSQLQWRRNEIKATPGGLPVFRQEYPSTPEEAVQGSSDLILPNMRECLIDRLPFDPTAMEWSMLTGGMDYGYYDATVLVTGAYVDQVLTIFDVYSATGCLAVDHAEHAWEGHTYWCDPSAVEGREEMSAVFRKTGKRTMMRAAPRQKSARAAGFVNAEWAMVQRMSVEGRLKIMRSVADQLILEADTLCWDPKTGRPDDRRSEECGHFDTLNALRYCIMGVENRPSMASAIVTPKTSRRMEFRR